jgi:hypothetical protein
MDATDHAALKNPGLPPYLCGRFEALGPSVVRAGGSDRSGSALGSAACLAGVLLIHPARPGTPRW